MTRDSYNIDIYANDKFSTTFKSLDAKLLSSRTAVTSFSAGIGTTQTTLDSFTKSTHTSSKALNVLKGAGSSLITKFFGIQMVIQLAQKALQQLIEWVGKGIGEFREFERQMAEVSTILVGTDIKDIKELQLNIERLSIAYGKSTTDMAKGMYDILSAAFDAKEGMRLLEIATRASIAGLTDVTTSVDVFTSILNAWGLEVAQAQRISDQLFQTVVRGKLVFEDLANAMGYIAPIAANLGVEFREIAAALSTVTRQGQHVDMATRGLALLLQNMVDVSDKASRAAEKYGVDMSAVALQVGGLEYIMKDLNRATKEFGAHILPELVTNMRSLRVAMALAGDEGIAGFIDDLERLEGSTDRSTEAFTKMMNIQQQQVNILGQSMEQLERQVGEAWSGVDIWWQKTKLWWGTLFAGGDADKAVRDYDSYVRDIERNTLTLLLQQDALGNRPSISELLMGDDVLALEDSSERIAQKVNNLNRSFDTTAIHAYLGITEALNFEAETYNLIWGHQARVQLRILDIQDKLAEAHHHDYEQKKQLQSQLDDLIEQYDDFQSGLDACQSEMEHLTQTQSLYVEMENMLSGALFDTQDNIQKYKENILTLERAMDDLKRAVQDTYTTIGGHTFAGADYWEVTTKGMETALTRFTRFSQHVIKYGGEMETGYMDVIRDLANQYDNLDLTQLDVLGSLEWFNQGIFDGISGIEAFDSNILNVIYTMRDYQATLKEVNKIQNEFNAELQASKMRMLELNLATQRIQLQGMLRRRGLTRAEQRELKAVQIEQAQERIKQMEIQLDQQQRIDELGLDAMRETYLNALDIYTEYTDKVQFQLENMKDVNDEELNAFLQSINMKEQRLVNYTQLHEEQVQGLEGALEDYIGILKFIAADPKLDEWYRDIYGINAADLAMQKLRELRAMQGKSVSVVTPPVIGVMEQMQQRLPEGSQIRGQLQRFTDTFYEARKRITGYQRGTYHIPQDMAIIAHRGEQIVPAGKHRAGGDTINIDITVTGNTITPETERNVASQIAERVSQALIDPKTGKSKYRLR